MTPETSSDSFRYLQSLVDGAKRSIDMMSPTGNGMLHAFSRFRLRDGLLSGKALRFIINIPPGKRWEFEGIDPPDFFGSHGWYVRYIQRPSLNGCLILDSQTVILAHIKELNCKYYVNCDVATDVSALAVKDHFERLWEGHDSIDLLYEDLIESSASEIESKILVVSNERWDRIISSLTRNPKDLYSIHPRRFEELVAELLVRTGMRIELTPYTQDGGRDILAFSDTEAGQHLYYVECKRYSPQKPVGVSLVRALYGVVEADKASAGLLVTTSFFTKGATQFRESVKHRLSLSDYDKLIEWLQKTGR